MLSLVKKSTCRFSFFFLFRSVKEGKDGRLLIVKKPSSGQNKDGVCHQYKTCISAKALFLFNSVELQRKKKLFQTALKCYNTEHIKPVHSLTKETPWVTFWQFLDQSVQFYTYPSLHLIPTGINHFKTRDPRPRLSLLYISKQIQNGLVSMTQNQRLMSLQSKKSPIP